MTVKAVLDFQQNWQKVMVNGKMISRDDAMRIYGLNECKSMKTNQAKGCIELKV